MTHAVVVSPEAQSQLEELYDYIAATASPSIAARFTDAIVGEVEKLGDFPHRGTLHDDILPGLRTLGFRKRVTIAFVVETSSVLVLGIFYGGQDFETILSR